MKPRTTTLFTPINIILMALFSLLLIVFFVTLFAPIQLRLWMSGYRLEGGDTGFTAGNTTYVIESEDGKVNAISAVNTNLFGEEENATFTFHYDRAYRSHKVTIDLTYNAQEGSCMYSFDDPLDGITCTDITLSQSEINTIDDRIDIHLTRIRQNFDWDDIPDRNRP